MRVQSHSKRSKSLAGRKAIQTIKLVLWCHWLYDQPPQDTSQDGIEQEDITIELHQFIKDGSISTTKTYYKYNKKDDTRVDQDYIPNSYRSLLCHCYHSTKEKERPKEAKHTLLKIHDGGNADAEAEAGHFIIVNILIVPCHSTFDQQFVLID